MSIPCHTKRSSADREKKRIVKMARRSNPARRVRSTTAGRECGRCASLGLDGRTYAHLVLRCHHRSNVQADPMESSSSHRIDPMTSVGSRATPLLKFPRAERWGRPCEQWAHMLRSCTGATHLWACLAWLHSRTPATPAKIPAKHPSSKTPWSCQLHGAVV